MKKKRTYTATERKYYYLGLGMGLGWIARNNGQNYIGSVSRALRSGVKDSFGNGVDYGLTKAHHALNRYQKSVKHKQEFNAYRKNFFKKI